MNKNWLNWVSAVSGEQAELQRVNGKQIGRRHFLKRHNDGLGIRVLCCVLYLTEGWKQDFGGHFHFFDGENLVGEIPPLHNRLLLFKPNMASDHAVEPLTDAAGDWVRCNYSFWFVKAGSLNNQGFLSQN